jgi:hypothetical protein
MKAPNGVDSGPKAPMDPDSAVAARDCPYAMSMVWEIEEEQWLGPSERRWLRPLSGRRSRT